MEDQVTISKSALQNLISQLKASQLNNLADECQTMINNINNNHNERAESPTTESSDCNSLDSVDDDPLRTDNFHQNIQISKEPLVIDVKKSTKFRDRPEVKHIDYYPMRSNPRGLVLIIANNLYEKFKDRRPSAKHDAENIKKLFEEMGFRVIAHYDLTGEEIIKRVKEFSEMPELRRVDSAFVIISSHGSGKLGHQETEILGIDYNSTGYKTVVCTTIMNYFTAENCRNLLGKPKIFIFQTCRGKNEQVAIPRCKVDAATTSKPQNEEYYVHFTETMRNYEDMLIVYSTLPGYVSYRDTYNGSWFIQILCEVFMNYAYKVHVQELFYMIDYRLKDIRTAEDNCQTPSITSQGFNKYCFINPGLLSEKNSNGASSPDGTITFKCCPDRKANIYTCIQCESVYHYKCAKKLANIKTLGRVKADCCSAINNDDTEEFERGRSFNENVEELKKVLSDLKEENGQLKNQIANLNTQHSNIISNEITMKNSEQQLKLENLCNENGYLKQLVEETKGSNSLLIEKNQWLTEELKKKGKVKSVKSKFCRVMKKKRQKITNTIEPAEI